MHLYPYVKLLLEGSLPVALKLYFLYSSYFTIVLNFRRSFVFIFCQADGESIHLIQQSFAQLVRLSVRRTAHVHDKKKCLGSPSQKTDMMPVELVPAAG